MDAKNNNQPIPEGDAKTLAYAIVDEEVTLAEALFIVVDAALHKVTTREGLAKVLRERESK